MVEYRNANIKDKVMGQVEVRWMKKQTVNLLTNRG